jgi:beta-lactam-binding protein with PASTA domain
MRNKPKRPKSSRKVGIRKVIVPNLSGLSRSQAKTSLESVGLTWSETASNIENVNLDQSIVNQGTSSGVTVNIGTSISFTYYNYVAPPPYYNPYYNPYNNPYYWNKFPKIRTCTNVCYISKNIIIEEVQFINKLA